MTKLTEKGKIIANQQAFPLTGNHTPTALTKLEYFVAQRISAGDLTHSSYTGSVAEQALEDVVKIFNLLGEKEQYNG